MNQEQFGQFWTQLKAPLKAKWVQITDEDVSDIQGDMARFSTVLQNRYEEETERCEHLGLTAAIRTGQVTILDIRTQSLRRNDAKNVDQTKE